MRELLFSVTKKDLRIDYFCAGGPGASIRTRPPQPVGECREERHQHMNMKTAFKRMTQTKEFQMWLKIAAAEALTGESVEQKVDRMMQPQFLKVEVKDEGGKWIKDLTQH